MLGCLGVSIIHGTLTWTVGYKCVYVIFLHVYVHGTLVYSLIWRTFGDCTEFDPKEILWWAQSLAHDGHLSVWWPCLIMLNFRELMSCSLPPKRWKSSKIKKQKSTVLESLWVLRAPFQSIESTWNSLSFESPWKSIKTSTVLEIPWVLRVPCPCCVELTQDFVCLLYTSPSPETA